MVWALNFKKMTRQRLNWGLEPGAEAVWVQVSDKDSLCNCNLSVCLGPWHEPYVFIHHENSSGTAIILMKKIKSKILLWVAQLLSLNNKIVSEILSERQLS